MLIRDFRQRINKRGAPYGWPISVYTTPEVLWGYDHISSAYSAEPAESKMLIYEQVRKNFSEATQEELDAVLGWTR
ncbi:AlkZ-related protein [Pseudoflavonifractor phocaeensis]|uniref:AlkZ-related protein n=1 Tax=Pseudoflavonifractor phocaeensis TaxID=1870988 RepID=UPI003DA9CF2A